MQYMTFSLHVTPPSCLKTHSCVNGLALGLSIRCGNPCDFPWALSVAIETSLTDIFEMAKMLNTCLVDKRKLCVHPVGLFVEMPVLFVLVVVKLTFNELCIWLCTSSLPQEPLPEAAALLLRHPGLRSVWGYGSLLSDGGVPHPLCHVNLDTQPQLRSHHLPLLPRLISFLAPFALPSSHPEGGFPERELWMSWQAIPIGNI